MSEGNPSQWSDNVIKKLPVSKSMGLGSHFCTTSKITDTNVIYHTISSPKTEKAVLCVPLRRVGKSQVWLNQTIKVGNFAHIPTYL